MGNKKIPQSVIDTNIKEQMEDLYIQCGDLVEKGKLKEALESVFTFIRSCNKYFDEEKPWNPSFLLKRRYNDLRALTLEGERFTDISNISICKDSASQLPM